MVFFYRCSGLSGDLIIPNGVASIGEKAFYECSGLNGILVLPDGLLSIGEKAFYNNPGFIGDLIIPHSVTSIGVYAFGYCGGLLVYMRIHCMKPIVFNLQFLLLLLLYHPQVNLPVNPLPNHLEI